jgi:hypothetical protein
MGKNASNQCNLHNKNNHTSPIYIENPYGGIPQNLLTNTIGLIILLLIFLVLRKSAWKVLNRIVRKDDVDRWTNLFFSFTTNMASGGSRRDVAVPEERRGGAGGGGDAAARYGQSQEQNP